VRADLVFGKYVVGKTQFVAINSKPAKSKTGTAKANAKPTTIDEYLSGVSADNRAALEKLRKTIHTTVPKAEECISYGLAAFRLDGKPIACFGAAASHCSYFPMSGTIVDAHKQDLKGFETSKGTIRFQSNKPLPAALVRKLLKARVAECAAKTK
jgi:uncharacterized protein YdhG (YjbR/CyaY superfamily)